MVDVPRADQSGAEATAVQTLREFRNFDHQTSNKPLPLFLDRNWPVGFHKPTMKAADEKVSHVQSRACSAA
jgi:hypothetical protein